MVKGGIYIDDAGNPGVDSGSDFLSSSRKSWTAVIVPSVAANQVSVAMNMFLDGVKAEFDAPELHFTDIYSGRGAWRGVEVQKRIEIFSLMKLLFEGFELPIVHQTASEETLRDHPHLISEWRREPGAWWNIKDVSHFGFLFLCSNVSRYIREMNQDHPDEFPLPMPLYVDEGLAKEGAKVDLPNWEDVIEGPQAQFCSSKSVPGIQLADFAAFAISRTQWIMVQQKLGGQLKKGDLEFLKLTSKLNVLNLPNYNFSTENVSQEAYEFLLARDRRIKGLESRPGQSTQKR